MASLPRQDRRALSFFLVWRAALWGVALLAFLWLDPLHRPYDSRFLHDVGWPVDVWARWDSGWFVRIAHHGYASAEGASAFFPLYPGLVGVLGRVLLGHYVLAAVLVSLLAGACAFVLFERLAEERLGAVSADRAVLYLALFPMAIFLAAAYSEGLYLALVLAAFLLAERDRWTAAAVVCGLALLTRSSAIALLAALAVLAWPVAQRLLRLGIAPIVFALFPLVLWRQVGDGFAFLHAQASWERHLSPAGPLGGLWDGIVALGSKPEDFSRRHALAVDLASLLFLALFAVLTVLAWRWFGRAYGVYCLVSLLIPLSLPAEQLPLVSLPRFCLPLFPCFLALARLGARPRVHNAVVAVSAASLGVALTLWVDYRWVS